MPMAPLTSLQSVGENDETSTQDDGNFVTVSQEEKKKKDQHFEVEESPAAIAAADLPWFDFSRVQETIFDRDEGDSKSGEAANTPRLPLFTSSVIFIVSLVGTVYLYYEALMGGPPPSPPTSGAT